MKGVIMKHLFILLLGLSGIAFGDQNLSCQAVTDASQETLDLLDQEVGVAQVLNDQYTIYQKVLSGRDYGNWQETRIYIINKTSGEIVESFTKRVDD